MEQIKKSNNTKYSSSIFWGVLLISFGLGYMLINYNLLKLPDLKIEDLFAGILVAIGIALLKVPQFVRYILNALIAILISIFFLNFTSGQCCNFKLFSNYDNISYKQHRNSYSIKKIPNLISSNLVLKAGAISIDIGSVDSSMLVLSQNYSISPNSISYDSTYSNIEINLNSNKRYLRDRSSLIQLNDSVAWSINADIGATDINADFSNLNISNMHLNCGASNIELEIGNKQENTDIVFESGASNIEITIPKEAICEVYSNSALSSSDFDDFEEINSGYYRSDNSTHSSTQKIKITISGAVSNFEIIRR